MLKVWDINIHHPIDGWQRGYAKLEYARTEMNQVGDATIKVLGAGCVFCNEPGAAICDKCAEQADTAWDERNDS